MVASNLKVIELQQERLVQRTALLIFMSALFVLGLKTCAYLVNPSAALYSDALETIVNVIAGALGLWVLKYARKPADADHPYGHGKVEFVSAAFEGGLVLSASLLTLLEASRAFFSPYPLEELNSALALSLVAAIINLWLGLWVQKVAKAAQSEALRASSFHLLSDVKTTGAVLLGLLLARLTGIQYFDSLLALAIGLFLAKESYALIRQAIAGLIDEKEDQVLKELAYRFETRRFSGLSDIHQLKAIRSGSTHHIDAHVVVPRFWEVAFAHEKLHSYENKILSSYSFAGEIAFHLDPCTPSYCSTCDLESCEIRSQGFRHLMTFRPEQLVLSQENNGRPDFKGSPR